MAIKVIDDKYLVDIADAIRSKTGTDDTYKPTEMATAISSLTTGGGDLPEEAFTITGSCEYRFANDGWSWFINNYGSRIMTADITDCSNMFVFSRDITHMPFEINCRQGANMDCSNMFSECYNLETLPKINNCRPKDTSNIFSFCQNIKYFPDDFNSGFDWSFIDNLTNNYEGLRSRMFYSCYKLRKLPMDFINHGNPNIRYNNSNYNYLVNSCYDLDEIIGLGVPHYNAEWTGNAFNNAFSYCYHVKDFTFALLDGSPYVVKWSNQVVDTRYFGVYDTINRAENLPKEKRITDDATYQLYKDDEDSWTLDKSYSRYNHDSAVRTINSLPDASAYLSSTGKNANTIQFYGSAGSKTDGGAINTLTEEEIAVAIAKGWTVSLG